MPDYTAVPPPYPAQGGGPPDMSQLLFRGLAAMPGSYYQGQQQQQQLEMNKPVIDPATGQPVDPSNPNAFDLIMKEGMKRGGLNWAGQMLPMIYGQQLMKNAPTSDPLAEPEQPVARRPNVPGASGPANLVPNKPAVAPAGSVAQEGQGDSIRVLATGLYPNKDMAPVLDRLAQQGVNIDAPYPGGDKEAAALIRKTIVQMRGGGGQPTTAEPMNTSGRSADSGDRSPAASAEQPSARVSTNPADTASVPHTAPPAQGASGGPGPTTTGGRETAMPASGIIPQRPPQQQAGGPSPVASILPQQWQGREREAIAALRKRADAVEMRGLAAASSGNKAMGDNFKSQATDLRERAKRLEEGLTAGPIEASKPTPEQKVAAGEGRTVTGQAAAMKIQEQKITQSGKTYAGLQGQSAQYERDLKPLLQISRGILSRPEMYTGTGGNTGLVIDRVKALMGDQYAAALKETLQKVTAVSVLGQINIQRDQLAETGQASSRIFSSQVDLVEKAAPAMANTLAGNRALIEIQSRMGELSNELAKQAREYIRAHGYLDEGFDGQVANYMHSHPIFQQAELSDPRILGAPHVPPLPAEALKSKESARAYMLDKYGLQPGEPFMIAGTAEPRHVP